MELTSFHVRSVVHLHQVKYKMLYYSDWLKDLLNIGIHNLFRTFNLNAGAIWVVRWITNTFLAAGFLVAVCGFGSGLFCGLFLLQRWDHRPSHSPSVEQQSSGAKNFRLTYYLIYHKYIINGLYLSNKNLAPMNQQWERCDSRVESPPEEIQWFKSDSLFPWFKSGFRCFESHHESHFESRVNRRLWPSLFTNRKENVCRFYQPNQGCFWYFWIFWFLLVRWLISLSKLKGGGKYSRKNKKI